jgi:hypothetical protein
MSGTSGLTNYPHLVIKRGGKAVVKILSAIRSEPTRGISQCGAQMSKVFRNWRRQKNHRILQEKLTGAESGMQNAAWPGTR